MHTAPQQRNAYACEPFQNQLRDYASGMKSSGKARIAIGFVGLIVSVALKMFFIVRRTESHNNEPTPVVAKARQSERINQTPPAGQTPVATAPAAPALASPAPAPVVTPVLLP